MTLTRLLASHDDVRREDVPVRGPGPSGPDPHAIARAAVHFFLQPDVQTTMDAVVAQTLTVVNGDAASAALLTRRHREVEVAASTTERAAEADRLQVELGEGPSLTAMRFGAPVVMNDSLADRRWPLWASQSEAAGFRSLVVVPLDLEPHGSGAISVYWDSPDQPWPADVATVSKLSEHAAIAVAAAYRASALREAMDACHQIGLAQGILMERLGLGTEQSFSVLHRYSRDNNLELDEIARNVVATKAGPI